MTDAFCTKEVLNGRQDVEKRGVQATHYLKGIILQLPMQKRHRLFQYIQSEVGAVAFHHNPTRSATQIRNYLTHDLWSHLQEASDKSRHIKKSIEDFSTWVAIQAPALSSTIRAMLNDVVAEDKGASSQNVQGNTLQIARAGEYLRN